MNIEELREYCMTVKGAEESFPFDDTTLVFKVMGKMFAFIGLAPRSGIFQVNLKCDPERSADLRERYTGVTDGFYAGKSLTWNGVILDSDVPDDMIKELVGHSVDEVVKKLPRIKREEYKKLK